MRERSGPVLPAALILLIATGCSWWGDDAGAIRARLHALRNEVNAGPVEGIGAVTRAADIAGYFTDDVSVELGDGSAPITGREMLMGMIARLSSRTSEYTVDLADVTVKVAPGGQSAEVELTAEFISRAPTSRRTRDAREFRLSMRRDSDWTIARVVAVQTLR